MSSSRRILKSGSAAELSEYSLRRLHEGEEKVEEGAKREFVLRSPAGVPEPATQEQPPEEETAPAGPPEGYVSEEDLDRRIAEAFNSGILEGKRQSGDELSSLCRTLEDAAAGITGLRETVLRKSEDDLLRLSMMVARKIIRQEISQDPGIIRRLVDAAVTGASEGDRIVIRLHPDDYKVVNAAELSDSDRGITLKADETMAPASGCIVETATGAIDATVETQLDEIYRGLMEERGAVRETDAEASASEPEAVQAGEPENGEAE